MAFRLKTRAGVDDLYSHILAAASTQYVTGSLVKMTNGLPVALAGQTDQPFMLVDSMAIQPYNGQSLGNVNGLATSPLRPVTPLLSTTAGERLIGIRFPANVEIDTDLVPLLGGAAGAAALTNVTKSQAIAAYGGSTGDFTGGVVYLPEQDWQGIITSSAVGAGNVTLVFTPAAPRACTVGDTIQAIPFGPGAAPKFSASAPSTALSNAVADKSGGNFLVTEVRMQYGNPKGSSAVISGIVKSPI